MPANSVAGLAVDTGSELAHLLEGHQHAGQADHDGDTVGDLCDPDMDGDGIGHYDDPDERAAFRQAQVQRPAQRFAADRGHKSGLFHHDRPVAALEQMAADALRR